MIDNPYNPLSRSIPGQDALSNAPGQSIAVNQDALSNAQSMPSRCRSGGIQWKPSQSELLGKKTQTKQ
jgi:hypothetical protein